MASHRLQPTWALDLAIVTLSGLILTDGSGNPTNTNAGTVLDQDGDPLLIPAGLSAVSRTGTGTYRLTLAQPWWKLRSPGLTLYKSAAVNGGLQVISFNPKGFVVNAIPAQTIDIMYTVAGTATNLVSAGFFFDLVLKNEKAGG